MHKTVQSLWIGGRLSRVEQLCVKSFLAHGHEFHLYAYGEIEDVPDGTVIKDANEVIPFDKIYRSDGGKLSSFSNYFRWKLLNLKGGLWVDMDMVCLKPFDFDGDLVFGYQSDTIVNTAVLGAPKGHMLTSAMVRICDDVNLFQPIDTYKTLIKKVGRRALYGKEKSRAKTRFSEPGGPDYVSKFLRYYGLIDQAKPIHYFYPIPYQKWASVFEQDEATHKAIENSYGLHLWNNAIGNRSKDDVMTGTLFGTLCDKYL